VSFVGLTSGIGGEGACITSKMFLGGWLYPDAPSLGVAEVTFGGDEFDCAALGTPIVQAKSVPTKRQFKAFRTGISSSPLRFTAKTEAGGH
jgi:hypothetical protein